MTNQLIVPDNQGPEMKDNNLLFIVVGMGMLYALFFCTFFGPALLPMSDIPQECVYAIMLCMNLVQMAGFFVLSFKPFRFSNTPLIIACCIALASLILLYVSYRQTAVDPLLLACIGSVGLGIERVILTLSWCHSIAQLPYRDIQKTVLPALGTAAVLYLIISAAELIRVVSIFALPIISTVLYIRYRSDDDPLISAEYPQRAKGVLPRILIASTVVLAASNGYILGTGSFDSDVGATLIFGAVALGGLLVPYAKSLKSIYLISVVAIGAGLSLLILNQGGTGAALVGLGWICFDALGWVLCAAFSKKHSVYPQVLYGKFWTANSVGQSVGALMGIGAIVLTVPAFSLSIAFPLLICFLVLATVAVTITRPFLSIIQVETGLAESRTNYEKKVAACAKAYALSKRETEVFELLAYGRDNKYIEEKLFISPNTVKSHIRNIYVKLGITTRQGLLDCVNAREVEES